MADSVTARHATWKILAIAGGLVGVLAGVAAGALATYFFSQGPVEFPLQIPVHATGSYGQDNYILATGELEDGIEAVFFLDALTGDLKAAAINRRSRRFQALFARNITKDFGTVPVKNPRYLMVTGFAEFQQQAGGLRLGNSVIYVMELESGQCVAYAVPANPGRQALAGQHIVGEIEVLDRVQFRKVQVRPGAGVAAPAG